jgi:hypothetical protein
MLSFSPVTTASLYQQFGRWRIDNLIDWPGVIDQNVMSPPNAMSWWKNSSSVQKKADH